MQNLVEAFDRHGAVAFLGISASDEDTSGRWAGLALAHGDGWEVAAAWTFRRIPAQRFDPMFTVLGDEDD